MNAISTETVLPAIAKTKVFLQDEWTSQEDDSDMSASPRTGIFNRYKRLVENSFRRQAFAEVLSQSK